MAVDRTIAALVVALQAAEPSADELAAEAEKAFAAHDYDAVTTALEQAYAIDPRPSFVYALAQADRLGGRCASAIDRYATYLQLDPPAEPAEEARLAIAECRAVLEARDQALALAHEGDVAAARDVLVQLQHERGLVDVPELALARGDIEREAGRCDEARASYRALEDLDPKAEVLALARKHANDCPPSSSVPPPTAAPAENETLMPRPEQRPWQRDPAAGALAGVGSVAIALGAGLVVGAHMIQRDAPTASDENAFADRLATARNMNLGGWATLAVGCTLLVSSAVRWGLLAREQRARKGSRKRR